MGTRTPSKYLSLKYLQALSERDYYNADTSKDYIPEYVDSLIWSKITKPDKRLKIREKQELERLKEQKKKPCSACKEDLDFCKFHKDISKKFFGLRSHCKDCRKIPF